MNIKSQYKKLFSISLVFIIGISVLAYWQRANSIYSKDYSAVETVEIFCQLLEKDDTETLRNFVSAEPSYFMEESYERARKNIPVRWIRVGDTDINSLKSNNLIKEGAPTKIFSEELNGNKNRILGEMLTYFANKKKIYLKEISEIVQNDYEARISVTVASRTEKNWIIPTTFWLYKAKDDKWRVFRIMNGIMNERFGH